MLRPNKSEGGGTLEVEVFSANENGIVEIGENDPVAQESLRKTYEKIMSTDDNILGFGNNGVVFELNTESGAFCAKVIWKSLDIMFRDPENYLKLSPYLKKLRSVSRYFAIVNEKRRAFVGKGFNFAIQNTPIVEAKYTNRAYDIATKTGFPKMVPRVIRVIHAKRTTADLPKDELVPDYYHEESHTLIMDKMNAVTIEDMVKDYDKWKEVAGKVDVKKAKAQIIKVLEAFSSNGFSHGDISTRNIMFDIETGEPRLIDFGTASAYNSKLEKDLESLESAMGWLLRSQINPEETAQVLEEELNAM